MTVIDSKTLASLRELEDGNGEDLVGELIDIFLEQAPQRVDGIKKAIAGDDARSLSFQAHSLKGSAANFGADDLTAICQRFETGGRAGSLGDLRALLPDLEREFQAVCAALQDQRHPRAA